MRKQQKARERHALDTFRRLSPDSPEGEPEAGEAPDFVVRAPAADVGIEIVEYLKDRGPAGSPAMAADRRRRKVLAEAGRIYDNDLRGTPALVSVHWTDARLGRTDERRLAGDLASLESFA